MNPRLKQFLSYYKPYMRTFIRVMLCAFLAAIIALTLPVCVRYVTKTVLLEDPTNAMTQVFWVGALMLGLIGVQTACSFYVDYRGHAMGAEMESNLRSELLDHYQKLPFRFYDEQRTGQLMSRLTNDLLLLAELYHHGPEDIMIYLVRFAGALIILGFINLKLTLAVLMFLPLMAIYSIFFSKKMHQALKTNRQRIGDINAQVEDNLSGIRVVKSFANEALEKDKFDYENSRFLESRKNGYKNEAYFSEGVGLFTQLILAAVVVIGGVSILNASLELPDLILFLLYFGYFIEPIQKSSHIIMQYQDGFTGFERFMEIMEEEPEVQDPAGAIELGHVKGDVKFINVGFRYREEHLDVLKNINLQVQAGDYIAIVGSSGVGKTTLCALIPRFYEVSEGAILIDGINVKEITLSSLRRNIGVVQQDVYLFAGTVAENIRYGKPSAAQEEIIEAAMKANAHDFIMGLPAGYNTDIGQRGVKLSGGQKQRLSIARVFLKDPPVLIFDEATSSLDNESEKVVQDSLEVLAKNRTTFVIAHRLSTIQNARRIVVLTNQGIAEQGTHDELMRLNRTYAHLYNI
jgi:ATP-binding cassette subfamily B protein